MPFTCIGSNKADDSRCTYVKRKILASKTYLTALFSDIEGFSKGYRTTNSNVTTATNLGRSKQSDEPIIFLAITCNMLTAREKPRVQGATGFGFVFHWLKIGREIFKPITRRRNRNCIITFDSQLNTALGVYKEIRNTLNP